MTEAEFKTIVKTLKAVYTYERFIPDRDTFLVWYGLLKDIDYPTCQRAIVAYMQSETRVPTPADIRKCIVNHADESLNEEEAWTIYLKAIRRGSYYAKDDFAKMPVDVQKAVGSYHNIRELAIAENLNFEVEKSHFLKNFRNVIEQKKTMAAISPEVRQALNFTGRMQIGDCQ